MALDPIILDDLDWRGMVEAIRRRIPAASGGEWTLHAPVDPGVTLLELFAWQLEQRLYRMDQVPADLNRALLALIGTRPRRTRCAATVLALRAGGPGTPPVLPRGAAFALDGAEPPLVFSTRAPLALLKLKSAGVRLWAGGRERSADLAQGRAVRLFSADGAAAEMRVALDLLEAPPAGASFSLYLGLRTPAAIAPQWSPDAAVAVAPPAELAWLYRGAGGILRPLASDDGTGGLRRSGIVRLRAPGDWLPEPDGAGYALVLRTVRASFTWPPRLQALVPNAVTARHAAATSVVVLDRKPGEWLPLPGNVIRLDELEHDAFVPGLPPIEGACVLWLKERDGNWHPWWPVRSLHAAGPGDRRFIVDRERAQLRFGDGLNGRLPVLGESGPGAGNIRLRYLAGGGAVGAVGPTPGPDADWSGPHGIMARNLTESLGGQDAETLDDARSRAAARLRVPTRAVTAADFEDIARATPGVAVGRAHAAIGFHPSHPCAVLAGAVTVFVVPDAPREDLDASQADDAFVAAPVPDPGSLAAVRARLDRARLLGTELFVSGPRYRAVRLQVVLRGDSHDVEAVRAALRQRLQRFLDPLAGGDAGTGWPFGEPLRQAALLREAEAAAGKGLRAALVAIGLDGAAPAETCAAVEIGAHDLPWLQDLTLVLQPDPAATAAQAGGLR